MVQSIAANLSLAPQAFGPGEWRPQILKTESTTGAGIAELWATVGKFREHTTDRRLVRQRARQEVRLRDLVSRQFMMRMEQALPPGEFERAVAAVSERRLDPYTAANELLERTVSSLNASGTR